METQFGQEVSVGKLVGWANKSGSFTQRKVGVVVGFGRREGYAHSEDTLKVSWLATNSWRKPGAVTSVGLDTVFVLDAANVCPQIREDAVKVATKLVTA